MNNQKIIDFLSAKLNSQKTYFQNGRVEYTDREMKRAFNTLHSRKLGAWKDVDAPCVDSAVDRITWVLNGSYGAGEAFMAWTWVMNNLVGKTGKNVDRAWLAIGRELTIYTAFLDNSEHTVDKIRDEWKKQNVDFNAVNARASEEVKNWLSQEMGE